MRSKHWTYTGIVAACVGAGAVAGFVFASSRPERYVSGAVLVQRSQDPEEVLTAFHQVISQTSDIPKQDVQVILLPGGNRFEVSFRGKDAAQAHTTNAALVRRLVDAGNFGIVEAPTLPQKPIAPAYSVPIGLGMVGGLVFGAATAMWRRTAAKLAL